MKEAIRELQAAMERQGYVAEPAIATAVYLARQMQKPLLVEGDAGVGKTEIAKVLARIEDTELIRLQCYEGLDVHTALYEWNYQKQLLRLRMESEDGAGPESAGADAARSASGGQRRDPHRLESIIFSRDYLLERPLLRAITRQEGPPVLLIDEIDRADEAFEAFLLELLSDFQVTIPELGTIEAVHRPHVVLTSNRTRTLGDALRRRCLYLFVEAPALDKEVRILHAKVPGIDERLALEIGRFMQELRDRRLMKPPGIAETLDWAQALVALHRDHLDEETASETLGCILKDHNDVRQLEAEELGELVAAARAE